MNEQDKQDRLRIVCSDDLNTIEDMARDAALSVYIRQTTIEKILRPLIFTKNEYKHFAGKYREWLKTYQRRYGALCPWAKGSE